MNLHLMPGSVARYYKAIAKRVLPTTEGSNSTKIPTALHQRKVRKVLDLVAGYAIGMFDIEVINCLYRRKSSRPCEQAATAQITQRGF
jgi:hypothetical protein